MTALTLGAAFATVFSLVNRAQERQLDDALTAEASAEAREIAAVGEREALAISTRPGPAANDVGPLPKYEAVYDREGRVLAATETFRGEIPTYREALSAGVRPYDLAHATGRLRAVLVPIPGMAARSVLLAVSRADLDGDAAFLGRAMGITFLLTVAWSVAVAWWFVSRLTREHEAIAETIGRVADGDVEARVTERSQGTTFTRNVDEVLARLRTLVSAQQRFVANAAHEIRTPLTAIYGEVTFVLRKERGAAEYRAALEEVLEATGRLNALADELLTLARLGAGTEAPRGPVALRPLIERVAGDGAAAGEARGVRVRLDLEEAEVLGRESELERVVRNLLDNALSHAPDGTSVFVSLAREGDEVCVSVRDQGAGVSVEDRERIFEPFFRGSAERAMEHGGVGLGLAITREIVRAHGGSLSLAPREASAGARFDVRLPCGVT